MQLLPTINAPSSGWTGPVSLVGLKLNQISGLVIALNGASPGDSFAFFFSQNGGLSPAVTGLIELATPTQIQLVNGMALVTGSSPVAVPFSQSAPPIGTYLYFKRVSGSSAIQIQVAGQGDASGDVSGASFEAGCSNAQVFVNGSPAAPITGWTVAPGTNLGGNFNPATGQYVTKVAGVYTFLLAAELAAAAMPILEQWATSICLGGSSVAQYNYVNPINALSCTRQNTVSISLMLSAGAVIDFRGALTGTGGNIALSGNPVTTFVSGFLSAPAAG